MKERKNPSAKKDLSKMILKDIKDSMAVDMKDVKKAEKITFGSIAKYTIIRFIGVLFFLIGLAGVVFILHYFGVAKSF